MQGSLRVKAFLKFPPLPLPCPSLPHPKDLPLEAHCVWPGQGRGGRQASLLASLHLSQSPGIKGGVPPCTPTGSSPRALSFSLLSEKQRNWQGRGGGDAEESPTIKAILDHRCFLELSFCMTVLNYLPNSCSISIAWTLGI
jgi:hypothetical protein